MVIEDPEAIEVKGEELDLQEKMEPPGPMGPVGPSGFPGRDGLSTMVGPLTSTGLGAPPVFNANLSTIGMENLLHYLGEALNHVMQFQLNVNRNMVEHLNMTVKNQELKGKP